METTCSAPDHRPPSRAACRVHRRSLPVFGFMMLLGLLTLVCLFIPSVPTVAIAEELVFPFSTDFSAAPGGTLSGVASVQDGRLRLTSADNRQAGSWSADGVFPSTRGLEVEFDYASYGGDGADGITMYLADGSVAAGVGQYGAALGYTCKKKDSAGEGMCTEPGVPGGYLAVALDEFGDFSLPINDSGPGRSPNTVAVRGPGDGVDGYRFVANASVPGGVQTSAGGTARTVRVTLQPDDSGVTHVSVSVASGTGFVKLIDDVAMATADEPIPATLRLGFAGSTGAHTNIHEITSAQVWQPADLSIAHDMPGADAGKPYEYSVTATNIGRNASAPSAVTITVPDGMENVTWSCAADDGAACNDKKGKGPVDTSVDLARGATAVWTIDGDISPGAIADLSSTATIDVEPGFEDVDDSNNTSVGTAAVTAVADLSTSKAVSVLGGADRVAPGGAVAYSVTAHNAGPAAAQSVGAVDDLPDAVSFISSDDGCTAEGQRVTCASDAALGPGEDRVFRFIARLSSDYRGDGSDVVNVATATSPTEPEGVAPSDPVPLDVDDTAVPPTVTASVHATPRASERKMLAYTGVRGTEIALAAICCLVVVGLLVRSIRRRSPADMARGRAS